MKNRKELILKRIIEEYIRTAEPVGSKSLQYTDQLHVSSATIRNELKALEENGYLTHMHTSSGRIPTDKGYRYFVDSLVNHEVSEALKQSVASTVASLQSEENVQTLLSRLLSSLVDYVTISIPPDFLHTKIKHIQFIKISSEKTLALLQADTEKKWELLLTSTHVFSQEELNHISTHLTDTWRHKTIEKLILTLPENNDLHLYHLIQVFQQALKKEFMATQSIHIQGISKLLNQPEFRNIATTQQVVSVLEQEQFLVNHIRNAQKNVLIGSEHNEENLQACAMITLPYQTENKAFGMIGIMGPKRMPYHVLLPMLNHVATLTQRWPYI